MLSYFSYLSPKEIAEIFYLPPLKNICEADSVELAYAIGALLYMPANRPSAAQDIMTLKKAGLMSVVLCLEDAIGDKEVGNAEQYLANHFEYLRLQAEAEKRLPLIFVRVRNPEQLLRIAERLGEDIRLLTGFVFPKFNINNGRNYFSALKKVSAHCGFCIYGMPILEIPDIMNGETRLTELLAIKELLAEYRQLVLNIRIGATDFSGMFGLRRSYDMTVYDIAPIRDCIASIINVFLRLGSDYVISGPVWEYFTGGERVLKSQLRETPFAHEFGKAGHQLRNTLI